MKWNKIWFLYLSVIIFKVAFFIIFLNLILLEYRPMEQISAEKLNDNECRKKSFTLRILLRIFIIVLIFSEIVQILALQFAYFKHPSNYFQILTVCSFLVLSSDLDSCSIRKRFAGLVLPLVCLETLKEV